MDQDSETNIEDQSQEHSSKSYFTVRIHKKTTMTVVILLLLIVTFSANINAISNFVLRTFPQLDPLANDVPEITIVEEEYLDVTADPIKAQRKGIEKCGIIPNIPSIPTGHWDIVDGPYWILDCKHLVWNQWTSGTGWIDNNPNVPTQPPVDTSSDGIYIHNVVQQTSLKINKPGSITSVTKDSFSYVVNNTRYSQKLSKLVFENNLQTTISSGWTIHTDQEYGFSFSYPPNWTLNNQNEESDSWKRRILYTLTAPETQYFDAGLSRGPTITIEAIKPQSNYQTLDDYLTFHEITYGSQPLPHPLIENMYQVVQPGQDGNEEGLLFESNGHFILIFASGDDGGNSENSTIMNNILQSVSL